MPAPVTFPKGSSPLARGTPARDATTAPRVGVIPARAGNTSATDRARCRRWGHPRSRGEHPIIRMKTWHDAGSSPLARGTHNPPKRLPPSDGVIPARAGNTAATASPIGVPGGSSPLARGTQIGDGLVEVGDGVIPARAGNTLSVLAIPGSSRGHPRSRGEHPNGN